MLSKGPQILELQGVLEGHGGWVTSISASNDMNSKTFISGSRDRKLIVWELGNPDNGEPLGVAKKSLTGHSHFISDVVLSNDGLYAISSSWDKTMRLWDITQQKQIKCFKSHTGSIFSLAFSADNRQIISGGQDNRIILWNTLAECKHKIDNAHDAYVSCVRFSPANKIMVSCGWDGKVIVWNLDTCQVKSKLILHNEPLHSVAISPDGSLCASGGKDGIAMLWDVTEGKHLYSLEAGQEILNLTFSPCNYWLCASTTNSILIWDLENKSIIEEIKADKIYSSGLPWFTSIAWTIDGKTLLAGTRDGNISVYRVMVSY